MRPLSMRRILLPLAAFAAVVIYVIWWVTYAGIHYNPRYSIRPPDAVAEVQGTTVRLVSLVRAGELTDAGGGPPELPVPGAVWVVAELETVRLNPAKEFPCGAKLLGPEGRLWNSEPFRVRRATEWCKPDNPVGQAVRFESIFLVPARYADKLIGVALVDLGTAERTAVLTAPV
jgi:hypothetical protein